MTAKTLGHYSIVRRLPDTFTVWAGGDSHVGTDIRGGRRSLATALEQSERGGPGGGPAFEWDIMLDVGDLSGSQGAPDDEEGALVRDQYAVLRDHDRSQIYNICGNHDANSPDEPCQWWFKKYGDPLGEYTEHSGVDPEKRPFPVSGQWDRYRIDFGNVTVLMMSDRNDGGPPVGRGHRGGYPAGTVTAETFDWWIRHVEACADRIVVSMHHHVLKETTVGSGAWDGFHMNERDRYGRPRGHYHGYFADGGPMGAGYLYWVDGNPDAQAFERYLAAHPGAIDLWIGGHTHTHPDDVKHGRRHIAEKWGVTFLNCAALTQYHVDPTQTGCPMSRPLTFTHGSHELDVRCYLHADVFAPHGWYDSAQRTLRLRHAFEHPDK